MTPETLFIIACILQAGDIYTTLRAIKLGAVESNPVIKRLMDAIGVKEALLLVKIAALIPLWVFRDQVPLWAWIGLIVLYVAVIWNNLRVIEKQRAMTAVGQAKQLRGLP